MTKTLCFLINRSSGSGEGARLVAQLSQTCTVIPVDFSRLSSQLESTEQFSRIVVAGGDGTVSAVLTDPALPPRPIGIIPLGTANDLCKSLSIPFRTRFDNPEVLCSKLLSWPTRRLAIWRVSTSKTSIAFCNYCSLGFEGAVLEGFSKWRSTRRLQSRLLNRATYARLAYSCRDFSLPRVTVESSAERLTLSPPTLSIIFANVQSYMGLAYSNSKSDPSDALLECVRTKSLVDYLKMFTSKVGLSSPFDPVGSAPSFKLSGFPPSTFLQIDGEFRGEVGESELSISLRNFVEVCAPTIDPK